MRLITITALLLMAFNVNASTSQQKEYDEILLKVCQVKANIAETIMTRMQNDGDMAALYAKVTAEEVKVLVKEAMTWRVQRFGPNKLRKIMEFKNKTFANCIK